MDEKWMLPLSNVKFATNDAGELLNLRGQIRDTSDLQLTMPIVQKKPIEVFAEGADWFVLDGHRRVTAARAMGWTEIWAIPVDRPKNEVDFTAEILVRNVHERFDPVEVGRGIVRLLTAPKRWTIEKAAALCGVRVSDARAMVALVTEAPEDVVKAVASGKMSLTAYSELRSKPVEFQNQMAAQPKPTVAKVRSEMRKAKKAAGEAQTSASFIGGILEQAAKQEHPVVRHLRELLAEVNHLDNINEDDMERAQYLIREIAERLNGSSDDFSDAETDTVSERYDEPGDDADLLDEEEFAEAADGDAEG